MPDDPLDLPSRRRLYQHINRHPGKYLRELQRDLGLAMGSLEHHLQKLERARLISVVDDGHKRFFPATVDRRDRPLLALLRQELPRHVLILALESGPLPKQTLATSLHVAPSTLNYHLSRLVAGGLLAVRREGRDAVYAVQEATAVERLLVAYQASWLDRLVDRYLDGTGALR